MKPPLSPDELQQLIAGYVLYDLTPEEAAQFEQWMASDPAIATEVARMQQALEATYGIVEVAPPPHLRGAIAAASTQAIPPAVTPLRSVTNRWLRVWSVAAAGIIVALGISHYGVWRSLQATRLQLAQTESRVVTLQPTQPEVAGAVTLTLNPDTLQATLTAANLPPLPPGKVYVLWTVLEPDAPFTTDPKGAILTQVFTVDARGESSEQLILPAAFQASVVEAIAITVEDAAAPQRHASKPILLQRL